MTPRDEDWIGTRLDRLELHPERPPPVGFLRAVKRRRAARRAWAASLAVMVVAASLLAGRLALAPTAPERPLVHLSPEALTPEERVLAPVTLRELTRVNRDVGPEELVLPRIRSGAAPRVLRVFDTLNAEEVVDGL